MSSSHDLSSSRSTRPTLTNQQFVDSLLTVASLPTTGTFRDSLVNGLNGGTMTCATVLRAVAELNAPHPGIQRGLL